MPKDGPCIFTGKIAFYHGDDAYFDDDNEHVLLKNQPMAVCDKTAAALARLCKENHISESTWHYNGGGCS